VDPLGREPSGAAELEHRERPNPVPEPSQPAGEKDRQEGDDEEVHAGASGADHHPVRVADESGTVLRDQVDAADMGGEPAARREDEGQLRRAGVAVERLDAEREQERQRDDRDVARLRLHATWLRRRLWMTPRITTPRSSISNQSSGSAPEVNSPMALSSTPAGRGRG